MAKASAMIIGAGAAGLMCAIAAGRRGRSVIVVDHNGAAGRKILVSGGGRCNFTNRNIGPEHYASSNPHFVTSSLARFSPDDVVALLSRHGVPFVEEDGGKLFCARSSKDIVALLLKECHAVGVQLVLGAKIRAVEKTDCARIDTSRGLLEGDALVIATGGLSGRPLGASDLGLRLAARFGLRIVPTRPALVPLTWSAADRKRFAPLSGVSLTAKVACGGAAFHGSVLLTHRGLSGPAILDLSSHWRPGMTVAIDLMPGGNASAFLKQMAAERPRAELKTVLSQRLPRRLAKLWCEASAASRPLHLYSSKELRSVAARLHRWEISPAGTEGYAAAEITAGGVDTHDLSSKTMEARTMPGLFFVGEVVDVAGKLGGFNLHWAWASGHAAGEAV